MYVGKASAGRDDSNGIFAGRYKSTVLHKDKGETKLTRAIVIIDALSLIHVLHIRVIRLFHVSQFTHGFLVQDIG